MATGCGDGTPSALAGSARPPGRGEPAAQPRELTVKDGKGGVVEVVPGQAEVLVPALRAAVGPFDPGTRAGGIIVALADWPVVAGMVPLGCGRQA